jgi:hypothetical protein
LRGTALWLAILAASGAHSCASAVPSAPPRAEPEGPSEAEQLAAYEEQLERSASELETASPLATGPDCPRACALAGQICELAERICVIARRHPDDAGPQARCTDGQSRCQRARSSVEARCVCRR